MKKAVFPLGAAIGAPFAIAFWALSVGSADSAILEPPTIPAGAYLGARINPENINSPGNALPGANEINQLPAFNASIAGRVKIIPVFVPFGAPMPLTTLASFAANGSIPLIDLACDNVEEIASGAHDAELSAEAATLRIYARPVMLRWYWEMTSPNAKHASCDSYGNGLAFKSAWQHIVRIFRAVGATNVAFVWCPSANSNHMADYYPGDAWVDWIAADGFDREKANAPDFAGVFGDFYNQWSGRGKPMMVGSTGALAADQPAYLQGIARDLRTKFPNIKAVIYFDALGGNGDWRLQGAGLDAFKVLIHDPYFAN